MVTIKTMAQSRLVAERKPRLPGFFDRFSGYRLALFAITEVKYEA
jgi:hypothetical protein